jgi:glycosyltransferase involved in cell wall biosynthesis
MSTQTPPASPLLSICVPTYSRPDTLRQTLRSILPNTEDIEILVCDNSSDGTNQRVVEEELRNCRCPWRYNRNNLPKGLLGVEMMVENFNMCVKLARGQYIYILHDDDYLLPGGLSTILKKIRDTRQKYHLLMFGVRLVDPQGKELRVQAAKTEQYLKPSVALYKHLDNSSFVRWPSLIIKKEAYDAVGLFDRAMGAPTDIDMWIRMFSRFGVFTIPDLITGYTIHENTETVKGFNDHSLKILLGLFDKARRTNLLSEKEINRTRTNFIYRWILAGVYRSIRNGDRASAQKIFSLFELLPSVGFAKSVKWSLLKGLFGFSLRAGKFVLPAGKLKAAPANDPA